MPSLKEMVTNTSNKDFSISEIEEIFLGAIISGLIDPDWIIKAKRDLFSIQNKDLYDIIAKSFSDGGVVDYLSVLTDLSKLKGSVEAKDIIYKITKIVPAEFNPEIAIDYLEEIYIRRVSNNLIDSAKIAIQQNPHSAPELLYTVYEQLTQLSQTQHIDFSFSKEIDQAFDDIINGNIAKMIIKTGISKIDKIIGGLSTQEITIIGARPGHGKTTSSIGLAQSILNANPDKKVVKFELEMSKKMIKNKFLSSMSGVSSYRIRTNELNEKDYEKLKEAAESLHKFEGRLYIFDNVYNIHQMNKICRTIGADVAMVDFITLMDGIDDNTRWELGKVLKSAKRFAKAHNMNYTFYSQLNRDSERRESHIPQMSDLAESDMLTQLASEIVLLFYKYKHSYDPIDKNKLRFIFDKARYSAIGDCQLYFDPDLIILKD